MHKLTSKIFNRKMLVILCLGITSGIPLGVVMSLLQAWMTESGIDLKTIGLAALVQMPYTLKFLWSPFIDRYSIPVLGRRKGWILISQVGIFLGLIMLGQFDPKLHLNSVLILATIISFFGASHDIVIDALRRDMLNTEELGFGSALATNSYLIGFKFLASVMGLTLADHFAWSEVFVILSFVCIVGMLAAVMAPNQPTSISAPKNIKEAIINPFANFLKRSGSWEVLLFILLYKLGDNLAGNLATPFYLHMGFAKTELPWLGKW